MAVLPDIGATASASPMGSMNGVVRQILTRLKVPRSYKPMKRRFGTTP